MIDGVLRGWGDVGEIGLVGVSVGDWIAGGDENPSKKCATKTYPNIPPVLGSRHSMPTTRGECSSVPRPCRWETCRYNLGAGKSESCALDVADRGGHTLAEIAEYMGEKSRQNIDAVLSKRKVRLAFNVIRLRVLHDSF